MKIAPKKHLLTTFSCCSSGGLSLCLSKQNSYEYIHRILSSGLVFNPVKVRM